jgi:uncharacterized protein (DUF305 family)
MADDTDDTDEGYSDTFFTWPRLAALVVAVAVFAGGIGYWIGRPSNANLNEVDIGFLADMTTHHQGAVSLGFTYLPNQDDGAIAAIAQGIVVGQSVEINFMNSRLLASSDDEKVDAIVNDDVAMDWMGEPVAPGDMPGLATQAEFDELEAATGQDADDVFTRLMIDHHAAGVEMAEYVVAHGTDDVTRRFARAMAKSQRYEIDEMNARRVKLGLDRHEPAGHDSHGSTHEHG